TPKNLGEAIQQAIEIEIATIPVYLYTYYSINRSPDQDAISGLLVQQLVAKGKSVKEASAMALDLSAEIMVFSNKAGALIMSVAIEEMLHMALSSNLKQALAGTPELVGKSPSKWPTCLPGHIPAFDINRAKLSEDQLMTFLKIESPDPLPDPKMLKAIDYRTIGQFYDMILKCINTNDLKYRTFLPQLVDGRGYYAPNNIDTVYYNKKHEPHFANADDSGDLVYIQDKASAIKAINCIVEQGEGNKAKGLNPDGSVDCGPLIPGDFDDPSKKEMSHFEKFVQIYCIYKNLNNKFRNLGIGVDDIGQYFVANVAKNPLTKDYPPNIAPVSVFLNAVYTYIFVMVENCYVQANNTQWEIFMFGIHKSMIFILNSVCGDIMQLSYTAPDGNVYAAAPTFEDYPFGLISSPKSQLIELFNAAVAVYPTISYLGQRVLDLPDVPLQNKGKI
ncbi:MAG: ferritin-like domain-containing protein, partial [Mucilaginibacter sp.]